MPKNIMEIDLRFLRYSEKIARVYSAIAQNYTLWKFIQNTLHKVMAINLSLANEELLAENIRKYPCL